MKKIHLSTAVFLIIAAVFITYQATYVSVEKKYSDTVYTFAKPDTKYDTLSYIEDIVRQYSIKEINDEKLKSGAINGMLLLGLEDRYAEYLTAEQYLEFRSEHNESMVGLGIHVSGTEDGNLCILRVNKGTPAMEAGLCKGDIIYEIDGVSVKERGGYAQAVKYIKSGKENTSVKISVKKAPDHTETVTYDIERKKIQNNTVTYEKYGDDIGYINISSFYDSTPKEFFAAIEDLKKNGAQKYVFDVRDNLGGELESVEAILDYLLPEGPIIRIIKKGSPEEVHNSDAASFDAPFAVLVNENTASAAELFSCALRDYGKAKLIGKTTFGKGSMQTMSELSPAIGGGALKITTGMYLPPFSDSYEGIGIIPDVEVELPQEFIEEPYLLELGNDPQFAAALKTFETQAVPGTDTNTPVTDSATDVPAEAQVGATEAQTSVQSTDVTTE